MIDIRRVRDDFEAAAASLARKKVDRADLERLRDLDAKWREVTSTRDELRAEVNTLSKEVGAAFKAGDKAKGERLREQSRLRGDEVQALEAEADGLQEQVRDLLLRIPNFPAADVTDGAGDEDNPIVRTVGYDPDQYEEHQRVPHWEVGPALGILDNERAAKISGSMFAMLRGPGATMARAMCQFALDRNADVYEEIRPPTLVTTDTLTATGQLPKFADDAYFIERDDLWLIPTAEVPLTSLGRDELVDEADLPMRLMAYTPCYRREAGSAGRDTRGLLRSHEFDKVETLAYTTPEQAPAMLDEILERAIGSVAAFGLAYRVLEICTGDLGQSHHKQFDIEVYAPGADLWLEASSVSWFTDYQARRANIRFRRADGGPIEFVHTLNGSALAVPRVLAAIIETNRQPDGSVVVPEALRPYTRGIERITPR
ncbi:MAG: seryl-tRNA synthetase [Actinomycetota bacterium]|jgi:seryl-tRNA synthetase|nr:seryl-tRNA synthetase [Actinomycetota bacterium]